MLNNKTYIKIFIFLVMFGVKVNAADSLTISSDEYDFRARSGIVDSVKADNLGLTITLSNVNTNLAIPLNGKYILNRQSLYYQDIQKIIFISFEQGKTITILTKGYIVDYEIAEIAGASINKN